MVLITLHLVLIGCGTPPPTPTPTLHLHLLRLNLHLHLHQCLYLHPHLVGQGDSIPRSSGCQLYTLYFCQNSTGRTVEWTCRMTFLINYVNCVIYLPGCIVGTCEITEIGPLNTKGPNNYTYCRR